MTFAEIEEWLGRSDAHGHWYVEASWQWIAERRWREYLGE